MPSCLGDRLLRTNAGSTPLEGAVRIKDFPLQTECRQAHFGQPISITLLLFCRVPTDIHHLSAYAISVRVGELSVMDANELLPIVDVSSIDSL